MEVGVFFFDHLDLSKLSATIERMTQTAQDLLDIELRKLVRADKKKWQKLDEELGILPKNPDDINVSEEAEAEEFFFTHRDQE